MKRKSFYIISSVLAGLIAGLIIAARFDFSKPAQTQPSAGTQALEYAGNFQDAVANVAKGAGEAVVSISTESIRRFGSRGRGNFRTPFEDYFGGDEFFRRFFEDFFGEIPEREYKQMGLGSGVIIDAEGYVLTNEHVVSGADKVTVTLPDGRKFKAEIKGEDTHSDLAVIKIDAHNLPVVKLGNSDELRIGDWVVAIGNPFGFALENPEPTVTAGVVSALHRALGRAAARGRYYNDLIQTDAAINPGNSGGPLVNLKGEIVGINVAIITTTGGYQGLGFAIPINSAKRILSRLISGKEILYGWLGVSIQALTPELAGHFGLPDTKGALVTDVLADGPAQKAGVKEGDVIRKFGGKEVGNVRQLLSEVSKAEVGKKVKVEAWRDKQEITLEVEVGKRPQNLEEVSPAQELKAAWRGIEAEGITPELMRRFGIEQEKGVIVADVEPGSPADDAGLAPGDIILSINRTEVNNLADYQSIIKVLEGDALVKTQRGYFVIKPKNE
ncbi:MAG: trypsin-like peptidase domain-containing protein [Candidatus Omnitrophota bacterium]